MNNKNICKFPCQSPFSGAISIISFVKETNAEVMQSRNILKAHRMLLVTDGEGHFSINGGSYAACSGTLLFSFAGEDFCLADGNLSYVYVDYSNTRADELHRRFEINSAKRRFEGFDGLIPLWQESLARASDKTIDLSAESIILYTFSRLTDALPEKNKIISAIVEITDRDFSDTDLSIGDIAQRLNYHPKYVSHLFKEKMGVSYSEYLRSVRLKYAVTLLDHGIDSVKNVALLSGFSDPLYFSKVFKDSIGVSPSGYTKNRQQNNGK